MERVDPYSVRQASLSGDRQCIVDLWKANLGDPGRFDFKFSWFYERSPYGAPDVFLLEHGTQVEGIDTQVVGVAAVGPRTFEAGEETLTAGVLVDMAVAKSHRTLFPALRLQKALRMSTIDKVDLLYGFPNPKAAPVFQRSGYSQIGIMARYVRVVRAAEYLTARLPRWLAVATGSIWDALTRLWQRLKSAKAGPLRLRWLDIGAASAGAAVDDNPAVPLMRGARSDGFLRWRFDVGSGRAYAFVELLGGSRDESCGYWVVEELDGVLHVRDCPPHLLLDACAGRAWALLANEARRRGMRSISFECMAPPGLGRALHGIGMTVRSERPVYGTAREGSRAEHCVANLYLTAADEDE